MWNNAENQGVNESIVPLGYAEKMIEGFLSEFGAAGEDLREALGNLAGKSMDDINEKWAQ